MSAVEMQARVNKGLGGHAPRPDEVTVRASQGLGGRGPRPEDVTAELDRVIAEHETSSDLSSPDQWTSGRQSGTTLSVPRLLRVDTNMLYLEANHHEDARSGLPDVTEIRRSLGLQFAPSPGDGDKNTGGEIDYNRPSRVPADSMSRDIHVPPEINEFVVRRHLPDVTAQDIDNDVMRGPEALRHVTSVTDHRQFDEESFSDVLTYYGSTGNLQKGGVLTLIQQTLSKATDYLKPPKVDNIHRTQPGYMKTSSPRHKPPTQRAEELVL